MTFSFPGIYQTNKEEITQRSSTCPCCHTDVPNEPSPLEYAEMMEEARQRMLKAERVSTDFAAIC